MKVRVTRQDIEDGRYRAGSCCGCPIWHALARRLHILEAETHETYLEIPTVYKAKIGRIVIPLPTEAVEFQKALMKDAGAKVRPFEFETDVEVMGR